MPTTKPKIINNITGEQIKYKAAKGDDLIVSLATACNLRDVTIYDMLFENITTNILCSMFRITFVNCEFKNCGSLNGICFFGCKMEKCKFTEGTDLSERSGIIADNIKKQPILKPTNEEIETRYHCKVYSLPNKSFVKIKWSCDFCHRSWYEIYRRDRIENALLEVPNCDRHVCRKCYDSYRLRDKFQGSRVYGYHGPVSKFTTPIDLPNTAIIGLEMEFEGDFYGWKELQDAHMGFLHYGYDSSVVGQNELSWDCGSYSWWKYLAPLKEVCDVLGKYGGRAGDSAGIHIHISRPDVNIAKITEKINRFGSTVGGRALFEAISLRNNKERFEMYSNLGAEMSAHHAGISYNSYDTCEFRLFNSTLDYKTILKHIKFCKEVFNAFADGKEVWKGFSKETISHITECAKEEMGKGFITEEQFNFITKKLG